MVLGLLAADAADPPSMTAAASSMPYNKGLANRCLGRRPVGPLWLLVFAKPTIKLVKCAQKLILLFIP